MILFIDAGHGGINPNTREYTTAPSKQWKYASGFHNNGLFYEGVSNRQFAAEFIAQATRAGFVCIPVYHPWKDTALRVRTELANHIAQTLKSESLYLSFHSNAANQKARGFIAMHHHTSRASKTIAENIAKHVAPVVEDYAQPHPRPVQEAWIGGDRRNGPIWVTAATRMPAVLLETLFFDNQNDAEILMDKEFCVNFCRALVNAL